MFAAAERGLVNVLKRALKNNANVNAIQQDRVSYGLL